METKFVVEKRIHEIIRDLPDARHINTALERGLITLDDTLVSIASIIKQDRERRIGN